MTTEQPNIIRSPHAKERPYFCMSRKTAQDNRLSLEARGILSYLLSKPDNWEIMKSDLMTAGNCGRDKINSIIKELIKFGYLVVEYPHVTEDGPKKGQFLPAFYRLHEEPSTENPSTAEASTPNQHLDSTEETHSTDSTEKPLRAKKPRTVKAPAEPVQEPLHEDRLEDIDHYRVAEGLKPFFPGMGFNLLNPLSLILCGKPAKWQGQEMTPHGIHSLTWIDVLNFITHWQENKGFTLPPTPPSFIFNMSDWYQKTGRKINRPSTPPPPHEDLCADPLAYVGTRGMING